MNYLKSLGIDPRLIKIGEIVMSGVRRFLELDDTPDSYDGQAGKVVKVNESDTALKFEEMPGGGDMLKSVYDTNDDGTVDNADKVDGQHASEFAAASHDHDSAYAPISKGVTNGDSHDHAGGDGAAITENALSLSDVTMANALTSKHGFCPKLPDDDTKFLDGKGNWSAPGFKGKIIYADSPAYDDVVDAVNEANAEDMVVVPEGEATWNSNLVINKGIILKGAGIDKTVITCNYNGSGGNWKSSRFLVSYDPESPSENQSFRLSGFTFDINNKDTGGLLLINTTNYHQTKIRIDHTKWENVIGNFTRHIIHIYGYFYGVADNNYIDTPGLMRFEALDTTTWANETFDFGTADNFYMEDNFFRFYNSGCFYLEAAGRLALRYNAIKLDALVGEDGMYCAVVPVHGNQANAWSGAMGFEAYGNEIYATYDNRLVDMRAGKTLFYNNTITQPRGSTMICAREEEYDSGNPPARSPISGQPQHVSDSYIFNNYRNGVLKITDFPYTGSQLYYGDEGCYVPTEDIHFFRHNTSFNGSSGVGVGTLSQRPSSCSKEGVAWWATDENKLYRWKNGKWELYYTPFPYPHPLRAILSD